MLRHLREVRQLCGSASPGRQQLREGALRPDLVGGLTFALDLSKAFDTVSRRDILKALPQVSQDPELASLVHALHHRSAYKLTAQGDTTMVETTTGIKQGCKLAPSLFSLLTGKLFRELVRTFGSEQVSAFLTGYADDLTVHRTIKSVADLEACHELIRALLDSLQAHKLYRNSSKCYILAKFAGKQAAAVQKLYTAWTKDERGQKVKLWRIGKTKYFPAFKWVSELKFLGIKASYGPFEMQTLAFRISEAKQKLHQVRKFVYNRRVASTVSRLRVWQGTVWPTLSFGLAEVGLSDESARALQSWYGFKIRSVLHKPAHISHMPTKDLFELHSIENPVTKLERLQVNRLRNLEAQCRLSPSITNSPQAQQQSRDSLEVLRRYKHLPTPDAAAELPSTPCPHCDSSFASQHGLRLHIAKKQASAVKRYIPSSFDRLRHAKDGVPTCRACEASFKQWPGLMSHLLSGACPAPEQLAAMDSSSNVAQLAEPLTQLKQTIGNSARFQLPVVAASTDSQVLISQRLQCGFWTPDYTKLKSHFRKVHTTKWTALTAAVEKTCGGFAAHTIKGLNCPFCKLKVHNRNKHCFQCPVMFQIVFEWHSGQPPQSQTTTSTNPTQLTIRQVLGNSGSQPQVSTHPAAPPSDLRVLLNSSNSCYINSVLTALFRSAKDLSDTGLEAVFEEMQLGVGTAPRPLYLYTSFALRSRARGWRFDGRQHDAAEFYSALAPERGPLQPAPWQARVDGEPDRAEHGVTATATGGPSLLASGLFGCLGKPRTSVCFTRGP